MQVITDLHIHSKYSRAVSPKMEILEIARWARKKGIDLVATGDWTHPLWLREIKANLEEDGSGLLRIKESSLEVESQERSNFSRTANSSPPKFLLSTEISSIYSQGGKGRRIHTLIFAPSIAVVEKINKELTKKGLNLISDGRPIIGLSAKDLAKLVLGVNKQCLVVPAHIWTPWFSMFGSKSGFDSVEECFGDMAKYIYGIETGLSSDPIMNWRIKDLDKRAILSFSDAHSGPKLGREATVFELKEPTFNNLRGAIMARQKWEVGSEKWDVEVGSGNDKSDNSKIEKIKNSTSKTSHVSHLTSRILYTIEFHPEEGKYHYTGHRNCQVRQSPAETKKLGTTCPSCGRPLTVGVMHRVQQLAGHEIKKEELKITNDENGVKWTGYGNRPPYVSLVPLVEILSETLGGAPTTLKIQTEYGNLISKLGSEFDLLLKIPTQKITEISGEKVAEAIKKVRAGDIVVEPGYDGVFGKVKIWGEKKEGGEKGEIQEKKQLSMF